jgi:hypothetical protein
VSIEPGPAPKEQKPRVLQDGRDMFWSLAPLVVACIVLAGMVGMCSVQLRGPTAGPPPDYDAAAVLHADAAQLGFPVRLPKLPDGWRANSGRRPSIEDGRTDPATGQKTRADTSTIGYLAPSGMFLSLTQSDADEDKLVTSLETDVYPTGTQNVDGVTWVVYQGGENSRPLWTTRLNGPTGAAQIAITGAAGLGDFRTLAAATQSQQPLAAR